MKVKNIGQHMRIISVEGDGRGGIKKLEKVRGCGGESRWKNFIRLELSAITH